MPLFKIFRFFSDLVGEETFSNFLIVLRCIRRWAKKRGLYGNKLGYLGGVNCNILGTNTHIIQSSFVSTSM